jgi:hypothetical protein
MEFPPTPAGFTSPGRRRSVAGSPGRFDSRKAGAKGRQGSLLLADLKAPRRAGQESSNRDGLSDAHASFELMPAWAQPANTSMRGCRIASSSAQTCWPVVPATSSSLSATDARQPRSFPPGAWARRCRDRLAMHGVSTRRSNHGAERPLPGPEPDAMSTQAYRAAARVNQSARRLSADLNPSRPSRIAQAPAAVCFAHSQRRKAPARTQGHEICSRGKATALGRKGILVYGDPSPGSSVIGRTSLQGRAVYP